MTVRRETPGTEGAAHRSDVGIIAVVPDPWSTWWQPRHQVLSRLAARVPVVWIEPSPGWRTIWRRAPARRGPPPPPGLWVPKAERWLPLIHKPAWLGDLTYGLRLRRARRILTRLGCRRIVLYVWRYHFAQAIRVVPHDFSCYHIDDEYSFSDEDIPTEDSERRFIESVDHVIVHSKGLLGKKGGINPRTSLIPNGVAFEAYARPAAEPPDLAPIPHPRIGYTGYIKRQLDWQLLRGLAARHPEWSFVFVGPTMAHVDIQADLDAMASRSNVHFLGGKDQDALATYPQHFDVCVMPYRLTADAEYIFPLKLHEYLASGRPTVGTPVPTLREFAHVVALAGTIDEWSAAIRAALEPAANSAAAVERRRAIARPHDWEVLVDRIAEILLGAGGESTAGSASQGTHRASMGIPASRP